MIFFSRFLPVAAGLARLQHCSASDSGNCSGWEERGVARPGRVVGTETLATALAWILHRGGSITPAIWNIKMNFGVSGLLQLILVWTSQE